MNEALLSAGASLQPEMVRWFEELHQMPEVAMEEEKTSAYVAARLREFGYQVEEGIGRLGMVATLQHGDGKKILGIRGEFDALPIEEVNDLPYKSRIPGKSHLCGHDAHTTMVLGAAKYLAEHRDFNGTLRFIMQPGEETMQGSTAMIQDGLFARFPVDVIFAMHNLPKLEKGKFFFHPGPTMASVDNWDIHIVGKASHGANPEMGLDPIVCGASMVLAFQTIVSRNVAPLNASVITVGAFNAGNSNNSVAGQAELKLTIRNMDDADRKLVLDRVRTVVRTQAESFGCQAHIKEGQPGTVLVNNAQWLEWAHGVAAATFGDDQAILPGPRYMNSEDFAFMLQRVPGCYIMLGAGDVPMVHNPGFIFDPALLQRGCALWIAIAHAYLK